MFCGFIEICKDDAAVDCITVGHGPIPVSVNKPYAITSSSI